MYVLFLIVVVMLALFSILGLAWLYEKGRDHR